MTQRIRCLLTVLLAMATCSFTAQSLAVNKCRIDGRDVYQSNPCPNARPPQPKTASWRSFSVDNDIGKGATIKLPRHWGASNFGVPELPVPTIKMHSHEGTDTSILLSLFTQRTSGQANQSMEQVLLANQNFFQEQQGGELLEEITVNTQAGGYGRLVVYYDKSLEGKKVPAGEHRYAIVGAVVIENAMIQVSILTNSVKNKNFRDTLTGIEEMTYGKRDR